MNYGGKFVSPEFGLRWHPTPVLLPGKSHGRRSLVGCSPWGHKELEMTEQLNWTELNGIVIFATFFNLSLNLAVRSSWSEPQSAPGVIFADCIRAFPSLAAKNIISLILVLTIWWCPCVEASLVLQEGGVCYDQCVLGKTLLAFALLHSVLKVQTYLLLHVSLDFLLLHSSPLWWDLPWWLRG